MADVLYITLTNGYQVSMKLLAGEKKILEHIENCRVNKTTAYFSDPSGGTHTVVRGDAVVKAEVVKDDPKSDKRGTPSDQDGVVSAVFHFLDGYQEIENPLSEFSAVATKIANSCSLDKVSYQTSNGVVEIDMSKIVAYNLSNSWACHCPTAKMMNQGCVSAKGKRCLSRKSLARVYGKP